MVNLAGNTGLVRYASCDVGRIISAPGKGCRLWVYFISRLCVNPLTFLASENGRDNVGFFWSNQLTIRTAHFANRCSINKLASASGLHKARHTTGDQQKTFCLLPQHSKTERV